MKRYHAYFKKKYRYIRPPNVSDPSTIIVQPVAAVGAKGNGLGPRAVLPEVLAIPCWQPPPVLTGGRTRGQNTGKGPTSKMRRGSGVRPAPWCVFGGIFGPSWREQTMCAGRCASCRGSTTSSNTSTSETPRPTNGAKSYSALRSRRRQGSSERRWDPHKRGTPELLLYTAPFVGRAGELSI